MKKILFIAFLSLCNLAFSQRTGTVTGMLTDKEMNGEPLPFANVFIKGTTIGGTTDFDGKYTFEVPIGNQTIVFSFVGYQTIEKQIVIKANETIVVDQLLGANEGVSLDEVKINVSVSREKESALLLEQKKASVIKESIGAQELAKKGVSDASVATTKIAGVTKSDASGDIYVRGLGDRYLSTNMNGLPIPSDNVDRKNINLNLFSTNIIQNVGISKTYASSRYADEASGNVDVASKEYTKNRFSLSINGGSNSNLIEYGGDFRQTLISDDITFGFHEKKYALVDQITQQGWDTKAVSGTPLNFGGSFSLGQKFNLLGKEFRVFATASHSESANHRTEIFRAYRANIEDESYPSLTREASIEKGVTEDTRDIERFTYNNNTTGYINVKLRLNDNNKLKYNTLFVNKGEEVLYEAGRQGFGFVFDQDPKQDEAFVRDQNYKQTTIFVNQLMGEHKWSDFHALKWAGGYNFVLAEEPNRIRNEVNFDDFANTSQIEFSTVGDFQQRKSTQKIEDTEYNGYVTNEFKLGPLNDNDAKPFQLHVGLNYRRKERSFRSQFVGVRARGVKAPSIDELSSVFTPTNFDDGTLRLREGKVDRFNADLNILAGFVNFDFNFDTNLSGNIGLRYEYDEINAIWDITNYINPETGTPRIGDLKRNYQSLYPSVNLKYELNEQNFLRFASSVTQTLPEFKELSPFEYVSPTGRVTVGNPNLEKSDVYNIDLKWEFFPSRSELISATAFYKQIQNPINIAQARGSSGNFKFFNTGNQADVLGLEFEGRIDILKNEDDASLLNFTSNITKMWFEQDLLPNFQYNNKTTSELQGASDLIVNGSLTYNSRTEREFMATLVGNYSSDKIFALGNPEDFENSDIFYNEEIIENGFVTLDLILSKEITKGLTAKLIGRNLLNPNIEQSQLIRDQNTGEETNQIVRRYNNGSQFSLNFSYTF